MSLRADTKANLLVTLVGSICVAEGLEKTPHSIVRQAADLVEEIEKRVERYNEVERDSVINTTKTN